MQAKLEDSIENQ